VVTFVGKRAIERIEKYSVKQTIEVMADVQLQERWPRFGHVVDRLSCQSAHTIEGPFPWNDGDVLEVEGVVGIISRDDADHYTAFDIPKIQHSKIFWTSGIRRAADGAKLPDNEAAEWAKNWMDDGCMSPPGLNVWRKRFKEQKERETAEVLKNCPF
jgi:hypothetical protein